MNGEDILLNFIAVNATSSPPLIIQSSSKVRNVVDQASATTLEATQPSLSSRSDHFTDRSRLFNTFAKYVCLLVVVLATF